jgi:hypothetical protein
LRLPTNDRRTFYQSKTCPILPPELVVAASTNFIMGEAAWENKREVLSITSGALVNRERVGRWEICSGEKERKIRPA